MAMMPSEIKLTFDIDTLVRVYCQATDCKHNKVNSPFGERTSLCNLKQIVIVPDTYCRSFEPIEEKDA